MVKEVNLDNALSEVEEVKIFQPDEIEDAPMTCDVPEGWSAIAAMDGGDCWYQRVLAWQNRFGKKFLPLKYTYNKDGNIVLNEDYDDGNSAE